MKWVCNKQAIQIASHRIYNTINVYLYKAIEVINTCCQSKNCNFIDFMIKCLAHAQMWLIIASMYHNKLKF